MFRLFKKIRNEPATPSIELIIDTRVYKRLMKRTAVDGMTMEAEVMSLLKRGIDDYWLHAAKAQKEDYESVKKLYEQSKHDNQLLKALEAQNIHFNELLDGIKTQAQNRENNHAHPSA